MEEPLTVTRNRLVPFYQNLSAITGSGKTVILGDAIEQIRSRLPLEPVVLWISKGKVVVWQTYSNLATGKYAHLIGGFDTKPLLDCVSADVENSGRALLLIATVAKFNQKDKEEGDRKIFRVGLDVADQSLWDMLRKRRDRAGRRRQLLVIYDEGHNLSNQQTALLSELEPDALLVASATLRVPDALTKTIERLRQDKGWNESDFITVVPSSEVADSGLVKKHIMLGGYVAPMELCVDDLLTEMERAGAAAEKLNVPFLPKAIYVSSTNAVDGATIKEDMARPFRDRRARPILIWRHLVEKRRVDPNTIAVYADLKFDKHHVAPAQLNLFAGGDADYDRFVTGNYRHIIFNLSLQEGWDDPACCFAYVDKEMGSPDQVTQVVGRVLRQPGSQHYAASILNTAHFYIRTDEKGVFEAILDDVRGRLAADAPSVTLSVRSTSTRRERLSLPTLKERLVPSVSIDSSAAQAPIRRLVESIMVFDENNQNTIGAGARIQVLQTIGSNEEAQEEWIEIPHSNRVTARWVFVREIQRHRPKAIGLCDIEHPKFDVMIEYGSRAADHIREYAQKVVEAYIEHSVIMQNALDHPYVVGPIAIDENKLTRFKHALHEGYSDLNEFEKTFAQALDRSKKVWCRNPSSGGFGIDLLDSGKTRQFKPDFLVWSDKRVVAIDPKGDHLIVEDSARKLFHIEQVEDGPELVVRLVTEGEWRVRGAPERVTPNGFSVWFLKQGKLQARPCRNAAEAVQICLSV